MKKDVYLMNILHIMVVGLVCFGGIILQAVLPAVVLPRISIPMLFLLALIPMIIEQCPGGKTERNQWVSALLGGAAVTVLPWIAGLHNGVPVWKLFVVGTLVFAAADLFYRSAMDRMTSGRAGKLAAAGNLFLLYLASQCFQGLI